MTTGVAKSTVIVVPVNVTPASSSTNPTADSRNIRPRIWRELGGGSFLLCVLLLPWWWAAPPPCERWWCDDTPAVVAAAFLRDSISRAHTNPHTHTHKRKQKFQRTLQNNFDFNTLCKTTATHFAKQKIPTHFACKNNCNALCETIATHFCESISTDFPKHAGQERQKIGRDQFDPPFDPLIRPQFFFESSFWRFRLDFFFLFFSFLFFSFYSP